MQDCVGQSLQLHPVPFTHRLPVASVTDCPLNQRQRKKEISWQAVYYHFRKWSGDGSLEQVWQQSIQTIRDDLDLAHLNLDGSHALAKKGGESVAYQHRKRAKTSNILPITDARGYVVASTGIVAGNHHDAFDLKPHLQAAFRTMKRLGLTIAGAYFNADSAFDTLEARRVCFNHQVIPNICENQRNRKAVKRGRKRLFDAAIYKQRFSSERSFAWVDSSERCSSVLIARMPTFSARIISLLRSLTCVTSLQQKIESVHGTVRQQDEINLQRVARSGYRPSPNA